MKTKISLIITLILLAGCANQETNTTPTTTTTMTTTSTTTTTTSTTTSTTTTTTMTTTSTTTSSTLPEKIITCQDYCLHNRYIDGICRLNGFECHAIGGKNEKYEPLGDRYCPKGQPDDACCCVIKKG